MIFKKFKPADFIIIALVLTVLCAGCFVFMKKKNLSNLPVERESKIMFDVIFRGISISSDKAPFQIGDNAFITIRNVPYTKLKIAAAEGLRRMTHVPAKNKEGYIIAEDVSAPAVYDFIIRLEDTGKKTPDGWVIGGNKIKMGLPVIIEGELYRYQGTVSNIIEVQEEKDEPAQTKYPA